MTSSEHSVLVYGGTGQQGRAMVQALREAGHAVRVLTRDPASAQDLVAQNVDLVDGDLDEPASLRIASDGVDTIVLTVPLVFDRERMVRHARHAVEAAEAADVPFLVYNTSMIPSEAPEGSPVFAALREATGIVLNAQLNAVVLRPPLYVDNLLAPWTRPALERGVVSYPVQDGVTLPWISHRNLARYVVAAVEQRGPTDTVLNVAGPDRLTLRGLADALEAGTGQPYEVDALTPEAFGEQVGTILDDRAGAALTRLYRRINDDAEALFNQDFARARTLLKPDLEPVSRWAERTLKASD